MSLKKIPKVASKIAPFMAEDSEQTGRHIVRVPDRTATDAEVADEMVQAEPYRQQVEERLEEPRNEEDPPAPIGDDVALDQEACPATAHGHVRQDP